MILSRGTVEEARASGHEVIDIYRFDREMLGILNEIRALAIPVTMLVKYGRSIAAVPRWAIILVRGTNALAGGVSFVLVERAARVGLKLPNPDEFAEAFVAAALAGGDEAASDYLDSLGP